MTLEQIRDINVSLDTAQDAMHKTWGFIPENGIHASYDFTRVMDEINILRSYWFRQLEIAEEEALRKQATA